MTPARCSESAATPIEAPIGIMTRADGAADFAHAAPSNAASATHATRGLWCTVPRVATEDVLQQHGRRERVDIARTFLRFAAEGAHRAPRGRRGIALVHQLHRE